MKDLNVIDIEGAESMIEGTARSMGITITVKCIARSHCGYPATRRAEKLCKTWKKISEAVKHIEEGKLYQPQEAVSLLKKMNYVKFDPTLEIHMKLGVDPRHADQMVRGVAMLPAGTGKEVKVLVFAQGEKVQRGRGRRRGFRRPG